MKRRIITMLLVLCMICSMLPLTALAAEQFDGGTFGDGLSWTLDSEGTLTISGSGPMEEAPWSDCRNWIKAVVIEDGITTIPAEAFRDCTELQSVDIPDSVTEIGTYAFYNCFELEQIVIPDSVTEIGTYAFQNCITMTDVTLPKNLKVLNDGVFSACYELAKIVLPEGLTEIKSEAFYWCHKLSDIHFPDSLITIGDHAFDSVSLTQLRLPQNLTTIGVGSFYNCKQLKYVVIPASVTEIGDKAFYYSAVDNFIFEGDAPAIGENAFINLTAVAFYPAGNETWTSDVLAEYGASWLGWTDRSVASVTVRDVRIMEGDSGYTTGGYYKYYYDPYFTVTFTDGTVYEDKGSYVYIDGLDIPLVYIDGQSKETPWGPGDHEITVFVGQAQTTFTVTVEENPIASIEVAPMTLIEGLGGRFEGYEDENGNWVENAWFCYELEPDEVTVHYKDGTSATVNPQDFEYEFGGDFSFYGDQSYENQWGVGTHTAYVSFLNLTNEFQVTIQESPVERIEMEPVTLIEHLDGYWESSWDENDNQIEWFRYDYYPQSMTVYYKDGTSVSGRPGEIEYQTGYDVTYSDEQDYDTPWSVGTNTATVSFMGVTGELQVIVAESPVERIEVPDMTLTECVDGYWDWGYDSELGAELSFGCFCYDDYPESITVYYKDGTVLSGPIEEIEEQTGYSVRYESGQNWYSTWEVGTHTSTASFMGVSCEYQVTIVENNVDRIEVAPVVNSAYTHGYWAGEWDDETGEYIDYVWFRYNVPPVSVTVYYKDGTSLTGTPEEIKEKTGQKVFYYQVINSENRWEIGGTYSSLAFYMGRRCPYQITIAENPVERIEIAPVTLIEKAHGEWYFDWDDYGNTYRWFEYDPTPETITVYYKDGTVQTVSLEEFEAENGIYLSFYTDQNYDNQWDIGTYTQTATIMNFTCEYQVTIVENPVERIEAEPITLRLGIDGYMDGWENYNDEWIPDCWYRYDTRPDSVTIYYKDGTVLTGTPEEIEEKTGYEVTWHDSQDYEEERWTKAGTYSATAKFLGRTYEYDVYLVDAPAKDYTVTYTSASISLAGDIGVNYYATLSDDVIADEGAYMQFTVAGQTQTVPLREAVVSTDANGVTTYRFSCKVAAKQMTENITGQFYLSDGTAVGEAKVYSVKAYCDAAIPVYSQYPAYADLVELMEAMLNYGGYSQVQFGYNTDNLANAGMDTTLPAITAADVDAYAHGAVGEEAGISVASVSLLLESTTTIRFYFQLDGTKSIDEYTFYVDGVETTPIESNGQYYVDKVNVAAKDLDEMVTVTVGGLTAQYCGLSYVRQVAVVYPSYYKEPLINVAKALYAYNQAANAYFA